MILCSFAVPFTTEDFKTNGEPIAKLLVDNSDSMSLFNEKTLNDVYDETDYKDRTVRKRGFGYTHPNTPKTKSDSFSKKSMDNPIHKAPISDISFDSSLPPIKFFVLREKSLKINNIICEKVIVKTCDSKEFAMGYINGANNWTEEGAEFKIYQGYLKEVEIER